MKGSIVYEFDELQIIHGLTIMAYGRAVIEYTHDDWKVTEIEITGFDNLKNVDRDLDKTSYAESMVRGLILGALERYHEHNIWDAIHDDWEERKNEGVRLAWFDKHEEARP